MTAVAELRPVPTNVQSLIARERTLIAAAQKSLENGVSNPVQLTAAGIPRSVIERLCYDEDLGVLDEILEARKELLNRIDKFF